MEIRGFPDYLIYEDGRVFSKKSNIFRKNQYNNKGYLHISLRNRGEKPIHKYIHRLVAEHFIPNPENKKEVDHINRIRDDNRIENLRWATPKENMSNLSISKKNTSGHKYITWDKRSKKWRFVFQRGYKNSKRFKNKIDAICYKFYFLLKINYNNKKFDS